MTIHNIAGSEIPHRHQLSPGYAALALGPVKRWQWRWRHTTMLLSLTLGVLVYAGSHGMLP